MFARTKILLLAALVLSGALRSAEHIQVRVTTVRSGDMITTLTSTNVDQEIKLAGVAAPNVKKEQPFSRRAIKALSDKILGETVVVEHSRPDRMGQIIGSVTLGDRWINREMIEEGWAWYDKTTSESGELAAAEAKARAAKVGLWSEPNPVPPWEWKDPKSGGPAEKWTEETGENTDTVYVSETSNKYHRKGCRRLREGVRAVTRRRAEKWSYKPCSVCKP